MIARMQRSGPKWSKLDRIDQIELKQTEWSELNRSKLNGSDGS